MFNFKEKLDFKTKIFLIIILPFIVALVISFFYIRKINEKSEIYKDYLFIIKQVKINTLLIKHLQRERGLSVGFIKSIQKNSYKKLLNIQRDSTELYLTEYKKLLKSNEIKVYNGKYPQSKIEINGIVNRINSIREIVDTEPKSQNGNEIFQYYKDEIINLINYTDNVNSTMSSLVNLNEQHCTILLIMDIKEAYGKLRATLTGISQQEIIDKKLYHTFLESSAEIESLEKILKRVSSKKLYNEYMRLYEYHEIANFKSTAHNLLEVINSNENKYNFTTSDYFYFYDYLTKIIEDIYLIEYQHLNEIDEFIKARLSEAYRIVEIMSSIFLITTLFIFGMLYYITSKSIALTNQELM